MDEVAAQIDLLVAWVTTGYQLRCRACYMRAGDRPREDLSLDTFALALKNLPISPGAELQIAGGEPTLVPDHETFAIATLALMLSMPVFAHDERLGDLVIRHVWSNATAPGAKAGEASLFPASSAMFTAGVSTATNWIT